MPWTQILTILLQVIGWIFGAVKADQESKRKFAELVEHLQKRKLVSANMKVNREDRLDELERKRREAENGQ